MASTPWHVIVTGGGAHPPGPADVRRLTEVADDVVVHVVVLPGKPAKQRKPPRSDVARMTRTLSRRVRSETRRIQRGLRRRTWMAVRGATDPEDWPGARPRTSQGIERLRAALAAHPDVSMVVAIDTFAAAVAWQVVHDGDHRHLLAVNGTDAAVRLLDGTVAEPPDLSPRGNDWFRDDTVYAVLPDVGPRRPRVLALAEAGDASAVALAEDLLEVLGTAADVVVAHPGEAGLRLLPDVPALLVGLPADDVRPDGDGHAGLLRTLRPDAVVGPGPVDHDVARAAVARATATRAEPEPVDAELVIAPANYAGQGAAWVRAVERWHPQVRGRNIHVVNAATPFVFSADLPLTSIEWSDPAVRARAVADALLPATHVLVEALRPILGVGLGVAKPTRAWEVAAGRADVEHLLTSGRQVGLLLHGSEARRPAEHAAQYPHSPFGRPGNEKVTATRTRVAAEVHEVLAALDPMEVPRFVSTPDMLDFVPGATWLPVVVNPEAFRLGRPVMERRRPVVLHAPSSGVLKGSEVVDPVLEMLADSGLIEYRRLRDVPPSLVMSHLRDADVVVDQVVLGNPGVLAAQALACGRVVVAHLPARVRERFGGPLPVVEATPDDLEEVLVSLVRDPDRVRALAAAGPDFAREHHDGRRSADVLTAWLTGGRG